MKRVRVIKYARLLLSLFSILFFTHNAYAEEGFVLPEIDGLNSTLTLSLGPTTLSSLAWVVEHTDDQVFAELVKQVDKVKVNIFSISGASKDVYQAFDISFTLLNSYSWEKVLTVNNATEQLLMFANLNESNIKGMSLFIVEDDEAIFINLRGDIDAELASKIIEGAKGLDK